MGMFTIDPKYTDFVGTSSKVYFVVQYFTCSLYMYYFSIVIPKVNMPQYIEKDDRLIPQWAIAVIVIGVGGLLFIIVFGVSVVSVSKPSEIIARLYNR